MALNEAQKKERSEYLEKNLEITECSQRKPYVFISYASDNWETVFKSAVVPMQRQYGLRVYADKAFDKVNDKWIVPMLRNIRGADVIIAFVSQSYIESYACFLELLTAVNNKKQIVFVSLEEQLRLGDTTDQPVVERGAKNEILNQGANISTNTNNTSNDIMRAMKSAYTSLSTLLEQDALSKYDISDAFINFFRDASINRKTINDLGAVRRTIKSVSRSVFDQSLVKETEQKAAPKPVQKPAPKPVEKPAPAPVQEEPVPVAAGPAAAEPAPVQTPEPTPLQTEEPAPVQTAAPPPVQQPETRAADFSFSDQENGKSDKKPLNKKLIGGIAAAAVVLVLLLSILGSGPKEVTDQFYEMTVGTESVRIFGKYTGKWDKKGECPIETGTFVVDANSDKLSEGTYEGGWVDGLFEGEGTMTWPSGRVYEGEWKAGEPSQGKLTYAEDEDFDTYEGEWGNFTLNGQGTMTYSDGYVYEGEWVDGKREGKGKATYASGDTYEGEWKDGQRSGYGVYTWTSGQTYEGEWAEGKYNGQGKLTLADGTVREGEWIDDQLIETISWTAGSDSGTYTGPLSDGKPNGTGMLEFENGTYVGEWVDGVREGQGRIDWNSGAYYEGEWKNNKADGQGTWQYAPAEGESEGDLYVGEFVNGYRDGKGVYTWVNGDVYEGEYKAGKRNGYGVFTWKESGNVYEGQWVEGKREGSGKLTFGSNGATFEGTWVDGERDGVGVYTSKDGTKEQQKWDHGTKVEE